MKTAPNKKRGCSLYGSSLLRDPKILGPRAAASAGRAHFVVVDSYGLRWVTGTYSARDNGFVASSFFAFFNGFLLFLAMSVLLHLICPAGHRCPYMQSHRQSPHAFFRAAKPHFHWLFIEFAAPACCLRPRRPVNSSSPVEKFNASFRELSTPGLFRGPYSTAKNSSRAAPRTSEKKGPLASCQRPCLPFNMLFAKSVRVSRARSQETQIGPTYGQSSAAAWSVGSSSISSASSWPFCSPSLNLPEWAAPSLYAKQSPKSMRIFVRCEAPLLLVFRQKRCSYPLRPVAPSVEFLILR